MKIILNRKQFEKIVASAPLKKEPFVLDIGADNFNPTIVFENVPDEEQSLIFAKLWPEHTEIGNDVEIHRRLVFLTDQLKEANERYKSHIDDWNNWNLTGKQTEAPSRAELDAPLEVRQLDSPTQIVDRIQQLVRGQKLKTLK